VAAALPYKDSNGQPVFCQILTAAEVKGKQQCILCRAMVKLGSMRDHVGSHILQVHVGSDACGFCGGTSCTAVLSANEQAGQPDGCPAYVKFSSAPCKKDRAGCNNHVVECPECKLVVWSYGMAAHYSAKHLQQPQPEPAAKEGSREAKYMAGIAKRVQRP
jgi:hypothetical protein